MDIERRGQPEIHIHPVHLISDKISAEFCKTRIPTLSDCRADRNRRRIVMMDFRVLWSFFLKFANKEDEELCASIRKQNVLIIDDVATSGSTLGEILRTLRIMNEDNDITIFSLMGRKDLMADAG